MLKLRTLAGDLIGEASTMRGLMAHADDRLNLRLGWDRLDLMDAPQWELEDDDEAERCYLTMDGRRFFEVDADYSDIFGYAA